MADIVNYILGSIPILKDQPLWLQKIILNLLGFAIILWAIRRYFTKN